jgi:hypothetical protein
MECYSLFLRLSDEDIIQNSSYLRNILIQPGPLSVPPSKRSRATPSFRVIDFGRGQTLEDFEKDDQGRTPDDFEDGELRKEFLRQCEKREGLAGTQEHRHIKKELGLTFLST